MARLHQRGWADVFGITWNPSCRCLAECVRTHASHARSPAHARAHARRKRSEGERKQVQERLANMRELCIELRGRPPHPAQTAASAPARTAAASPSRPPPPSPCGGSAGGGRTQQCRPGGSPKGPSGSIPRGSGSFPGSSPVVDMYRRERSSGGVGVWWGRGWDQHPGGAEGFGPRASSKGPASRSDIATSHLADGAVVVWAEFVVRQQHDRHLVGAGLGGRVLAC